MRVLLLMIPMSVFMAKNFGLDIVVGASDKPLGEKISVPSQGISTQKDWLPIAAPIPLPNANPAPSLTPVSPVNPADPVHLSLPAAETSGNSGTPDNADDVLLPAPPATPRGNINLTRAGTQTRTALSGGTVQIRPYLFTYNTAAMVIKLYEADGSEVRFSGKPLLQWRRDDDMDASGVHFRGVRDASSMIITAGDPSPRTGLVYTFTITPGQKIRATMSGRPVSGTAFLRIDGPAGMF